MTNGKVSNVFRNVLMTKPFLQLLDSRWALLRVFGRASRPCSASPEDPDRA